MKQNADFTTSDSYLKEQELERANEAKAQAKIEEMFERGYAYTKIAERLNDALEALDQLKDETLADFDEEISMNVVNAYSLLQQSFDKAWELMK